MVCPILPEPSEEQFRTGGCHTAYRDQCGTAFEGDAEVFVGLDAATEVYRQPVAEARRSNTLWLTICLERAPSRSTTCKRLKP